MNCDGCSYKQSGGLEPCPHIEAGSCPRLGTHTVELAPVLTAPGVRKILRTPEDWVEAEKVIKDFPPMTAHIFGVNIIVS